MVGALGRVTLVVVVAVVATAAAPAPTASAAPRKPPAKALERWEKLPEPAAMPDATGHGDVEVAGAHIYYATYGTGDGAPVILLHGGLGNSDHWGSQLPALVDKFRVIAIDSRGQGRSTRTKTTISYDLMASDVVAVMDSLKIERASIVGWSDGGEVALKLGIQHPDRVDKLFVFGANYDANGSKPRGSRSPTFAAYAARCHSQFAKISKTPRGWDNLVEALLPLWRAPTGITKDQLRGIAAPTLLADGDHDEGIVLDQLQEMSQLIPHAQLKVFSDASHFALWQAPDDFNTALVEFLAPPKQ